MIQDKSEELRLEGAPLVREEEAPSFLIQHGQKLGALFFWLLVLSGYFWYTLQNNLGPLEAVNQLIDLLSNSRYGPLLYLLIYALRPLILFSASLLTIAAGLLFGPIWGWIYTVLGSNTSAMVAYMIGRYFGQGLLEKTESNGVVQRYTRRMRESPFETVLIMRFIFLPYDLVNYLAGLLQIDWKAFLLATALGSIPGSISFVLIGASIEGDIEGFPSLNLWTLAISALILVVSIGLAQYFKQREKVSKSEAGDTLPSEE
jgi:uncharacterized membrane protein YdjX (TVP38/TMEM64 family)